jgi:hypothetical protein
MLVPFPKRFPSQSRSILSQGRENSQMQGASVMTEAGIDLGGTVGNDNELQGALGLHYTKQLTKSWETTMSNSQERSVETRFSRSGALFVWTWDIKETSLGTHLGSYKSAEHLGGTIETIVFFECQDWFLLVYVTTHYNIYNNLQ